MTFPFDNTYARLPDRFFARVRPEPVQQPSLLCFNQVLAAQLGLEPSDLDDPELRDIFCGNVIPEGAEPLAMAYAGHQFGSFVPQLGDGRAILLGEMVPPSGTRVDIQLKGSGRTPFSRAGDGRAWIGPVLREFLISEAMHSLAIPTTRSLAVVATGEPVYREAPLPGAVLTRVAQSHVRVGTFEYFRARQDEAALSLLADYVIDRHYPQARQSDRPYASLLTAVAERQAELIAAWLSVGFIHGVMNTDNMSICGETIDYGPCAFMDAYDPTTVFSSIDYRGRYAYGNQARIARWNLSSFALSLRPVLEQESKRAAADATAALDRFTEAFDHHWLRRFGEKLGLSEVTETDRPLIRDFLALLHEQQADFTNSFRALCDAAEKDEGALAKQLDPAASAPWLEAWRSRLASDPQPSGERAVRMRQANPAVIPRNHRVEQALNAAVEGNLTPFGDLLAVLRAPWDDPADESYRSPPAPTEKVLYTFCGT